MLTKFLTFISAMALTACAEFGVNPVNKNASSEAVSDLTSVQPGKCDGLSYYHNLTLLTHEARSQELAELHQAQKNPNKSCAPLKLAMLFDQPDIGIQNSSKAKSLLDKFIPNSQKRIDSDVVLAKLLRASIEERLRLQGSRNSLQRKVEQQHIAMEALAGRILELTSQLDQLKSLEQDINQQEQAVGEPEN